MYIFFKQDQKNPSHIFNDPFAGDFVIFVIGAITFDKGENTTF